MKRLALLAVALGVTAAPAQMNPGVEDPDFACNEHTCAIKPGGPERDHPQQEPPMLRALLICLVAGGALAAAYGLIWAIEKFVCKWQNSEYEDEHD